MSSCKCFASVLSDDLLNSMHATNLAAKSAMRTQSSNVCEERARWQDAIKSGQLCEDDRRKSVERRVHALLLKFRYSCMCLCLQAVCLGVCLRLYDSVYLNVRVLFHAALSMVCNAQAYGGRYLAAAERRGHELSSGPVGSSPGSHSLRRFRVSTMLSCLILCALLNACVVRLCQPFSSSLTS